MNPQFHLIVYTDGGSRGNPGPAGAGFVATKDGQELIKRGLYLGQTTNNVAEYQALLKALSWVINSPYKNQLQKISFFLDSLLIVNQLNGLYRIKKPHLNNLAIQIKALERQLAVPVSYRHVPREQNKLADSLVNEALDRKEDFTL